MTSALLIGRNRVAALMTSAYLLEEAMSSKDDVSSKLQYIQQSTRSARVGSAMMESAVTSAISRELQCNQKLILEVSDSKTMSFGLIDTTAFCLRAKIQQMLFALITSSRKIPVARYQSQGTSRKMMNQSQATVFCISSRRKSRRRKSRRSEDLQTNRQRIQT
ncbi:hypothetical protein F511_34818 [Dorcoceras hygrometricum]|uniref:Uncharacterized protein n=1 Tax=Dorcoceras hygrometricum TaxID=472368 RepID=A0A2Z7D0H8_9LAMI|nr:hypothetical protein F511_34818 [Dorcoceras hygrometricum]